MSAVRKLANELANAVEPHVRTLHLAITVAQAERELVDEIKTKELAAQRYYGREPDGGEFRVTEPKYDWRMDDTSAAKYHARLNAIHLANGFERAADGYCPALCAEHLQTQAEWALIEAAESFFPGVTNDKLLCGTKDLGGLETRRKYIHLLIGLVVNRSEFKMSLKGGA